METHVSVQSFVYTYMYHDYSFTHTENNKEIEYDKRMTRIQSLLYYDNSLGLLVSLGCQDAL